MALKLKMLFRVYVVLPWTMVLKLPTAYIVWPHCTIWRTSSIWGVEAGKCGNVVGGVADTTPAGVGSPPVPACAAGMETASNARAGTTAIRYFRIQAPYRRSPYSAQPWAQAGRMPPPNFWQA